LKAELTEDISGLNFLEPEWNDLLSRSKVDTIFLTWEWIHSWFEVVGETVKPFIVSVRGSDRRLLGIAPFYIVHYRLVGVVPYKVLRFAGDYASGMDYPDWIVDQESEGAVTTAIVELLADVRKRWDCIWMSNVSGWTGAEERILKTCREAGFHCHTRPRVFAYVDLPEKMESYLKMLSGNRRQQLARQTRKILGRKGASNTKVVDTHQLPRFLDYLFDLHNRRWAVLGKKGTFERKPNEARFYREFTPRAFDKGWLRLYGLEKDGELKAVQIGYVYNRIYFQIQEGFDPDYIEGAGNVLRAKVIEDCIEEGVKTYDFLGEMTEHKRRWLSKERTGFDFFIGRKCAKNTLLFLKEVWPSGKYLRPVVLPGG